MNNKLLLEYISRYVDLTPSEINLLLENIPYRKYLKGQYIVQHGTSAVLKVLSSKDD